MPIYLLFYMSVNISISIYMSICHCVTPTIHLRIYLFIYQLLTTSISLSPARSTTGGGREQSRQLATQGAHESFLTEHKHSLVHTFISLRTLTFPPLHVAFTRATFGLHGYPLPRTSAMVGISGLLMSTYVCVMFIDTSIERLIFWKMRGQRFYFVEGFISVTALTHILDAGN